MGLEFNICHIKLWNQFFFFLVEILTLTKMDRLTITERMKIIKTYYKNDDSATATYHALRGDYVSDNRPTMQQISKIVKKLKRLE